MNSTKYFGQEFMDDMQRFVTNEEFPEDEEVISWKDVPEKTWLRIVRQRNVAKTDGDDVKILSLMQRDGTTFDAWTTPFISKDIDNLQNERAQKRKLEEIPSAHLYVQSQVERVSKANPSRSYFHTKLRFF